MSNPIKSVFYTIYNTNTESYYYSVLYNRFFHMLSLKKNLVLDNTNNVSNISVQGKINFFDLNNNLYCLNAYYLQNFYKIKQKKNKKNKKKSVVKYLKKKKSNQVSVYLKLKSLSRVFKYLKIKNHKNFVKSQYVDFYLNNFIFNKLGKFLVTGNKEYIFTKSYGKTYILFIEKLFNNTLNNESHQVNSYNINAYNLLYSYICEYSYSLNLHPIFALPLHYNSNENNNFIFDLNFSYINFLVGYDVNFNSN